MTQSEAQIELLVITDLDGSLLDKDSYRADAAAEALAQLKTRNIPLVLNSSKTAAEISKLSETLGNVAAFICENGAALHFNNLAGSTSEIIDIGRQRKLWIDKLHELRKSRKWLFEGFSDWNNKQLSKVCGLSEEAANEALQRQYSEPIIWQDSREAYLEFENALEELELTIKEGGRFLSIQSNHDKSFLLQELASKLFGDNAFLKIILGDSPNDTEMLEQADVAVVIKSDKSNRIKLTSPKHIIETQSQGPAGWQEAMLKILSQYDTNSLLSSEELNHG